MKNILIVDDATLMRNIIKSCLPEDEFTFIEADNGQDAIDLYKQKRPDVVTMDITMDQKDGLNAAREILEFDTTAQVIMVTSLGQEKLLSDCLKAGARDYLVKPFTKERVKSAVRKAIDMSSS
jgi:two-component system, chemotaxis family, chemotaxis protein CheY